MKVRHMMTIKSVVCVVFGLPALFFPSALISLYGATLNETGAYMTRLLGASWIMLAVLLWLARNDPGSEARRAIIVGVIVGDAVAFAVALLAQLTITINELGWTTVLVYLTLTLGFAYVAFTRPSES